MPKHSFIAWILMKGKILVNRRLHKLFSEIGLTCDLCNKGKETQDHLFFECNYARNVWAKVRAWVGMKVEAATLQERVEYIIEQNR